MIHSLEGLWQADIGDSKSYPMTLPGTLDENQIGYKDEGSNQWHPADNLGEDGSIFGKTDVIPTRFTRKFTYEGPARISRKISYVPPTGKRVFFEVERARGLKLMVNEKEIPYFNEPSISTPYVFEITGLLNGDHMLTLISDNSYPGWPHDAIVFSSAATDETQTNWNGVLGYVRLRMEDPIFISSVRVYPKQERLIVKIELSAVEAYSGMLSIKSGALEQVIEQPVSLDPGIHEFEFTASIKPDALRWDEMEGHLHHLVVGLSGHQEKDIRFGIRDFGSNQKGRLTLNGRAFFMRSEANCAVFPETGYCPMTIEEWHDILSVYRAYGVNCMRFHSHCPPEAAFAAADEMGMMMQPELSHWNPRDAFESDESFSYYQTELKQILLHLANHPSFVMLTFGNELCAHALGHARMSQMLAQAHAIDDTRLYADGSNTHYGRVGCDQDSDFFASQKFYEHPLRGTFAGHDQGIEGYINNQYPNAKTNYDPSMAALRDDYQKPVISFEVGQFEVLPDFKELSAFHGILDPANYRLIQENVRNKGLETKWEQYVEASGELSKIGYREEVEAALRTEGLSGISLLGIQDFPGQGTALVGMLDAHLRSKPYDFAKPEAFHAFFRAQLPLVYLERYTYLNTETLIAPVRLANYGKHAIQGEVRYQLCGGSVSLTGVSGRINCEAGILSEAVQVEIPLKDITQPSRLNLTVSIDSVTNTYPIWVYPPVQPVCPAEIHETERLDEAACAVLERGGKVYLSPASTKEALPSSIRAQFTTDFWSVGTFSGQEGGMGQYIDRMHPIFQAFPTEAHTNWQWWPMATQRAVILPEPIEAIITEMDSYAYLRPMAQLFECRCGNGLLVFSSMGLQDLQQYPEARMLLSAIYQYMASDAFAPKQCIELGVIQSLVK